MKRHKMIRLNNVYFPLWFFFLYPTPVWLLILVINFIIDSAVVCGGCRYLKKSLDVYKKSILKVWLIGFISDFIGAGMILLMGLIIDYLNIPYEWGRGIYCILFSLPGLLISMMLIYRLNKRFSFTRTSLDPESIQKLCLYLAVLTAPYVMVIPTYW